MNEEENFPIDIDEDIQRKQMSDGLRNYEDLKEKEKRYIIRIFPFTPNRDICRKFGIDQPVLDEVKIWGRENNLPVQKNETFSRTVIPVAQGGKLTKKTKEKYTPGGLMSSYMNHITEEERRQIMNLWEEGIEPIPMMKEVIAIQSQRASRGAGMLERRSDTLHKTVNECFADLSTMIVRLNEMQEGHKITHEVGDSFKQLVMNSYRKREDYEREEP
jgi:hypothetical protein